MEDDQHEQDFVDFNIKGIVYPANLSILQEQSPFFAALFPQRTLLAGRRMSFQVSADIEPQVFGYFLDFLQDLQDWIPKFNDDIKEAEKLLYVAEKYKVTNLVSMLCDIILKMSGGMLLGRSPPYEDFSDDSFAERCKQGYRHEGDGFQSSSLPWSH